jgi:hypothetical protein
MTIRGADLKTAAIALANVAGAMNPGVAAALSGADALIDLFQEKKKLDAIFEKVMAETLASAPEVAQQVSEFYTVQSDALRAEFAARPGK